MSACRTKKGRFTRCRTSHGRAGSRAKLGPHTLVRINGSASPEYAGMEGMVVERDHDPLVKSVWWVVVFPDVPLARGRMSNMPGAEAAFPEKDLTPIKHFSKSFAKKWDVREFADRHLLIGVVPS